MRCFLHCGAPKTGTSAIQEAFFYHLRHPGFQYFSGGYIDNGSFVIEALFADDPYCKKLYENHLASSRGPFPIYRQRLRHRLAKAVQDCQRRQADLILSAEGLWRSTPESFLRMRRLKAYLLEEGFEIVVMAYLRPWLPWLASLYQQSLKFGNKDFSIDMFQELLDFQALIQELWSVFGSDSVQIYPYDSSLFPGGCVVQHFCRQIGFPCPPSWRLAANESLSLPACQFLFAYNRHRGELSPTGLPRGAEYAPILRHLHHLPGPPLRLDASVLDRWLPRPGLQGAWLEAELGMVLGPTGRPAMPSGVSYRVASEAEMARFSPEALDWLCQRTGCSSISVDSDMGMERAVAEAVRRLTGRWQHYRSLPRRAIHRLRAKLIHHCHGC